MLHAIEEKALSVVIAVRAARRRRSSAWEAVPRSPEPDEQQEEVVDQA